MLIAYFLAAAVESAAGEARAIVPVHRWTSGGPSDGAVVSVAVGSAPGVVFASTFENRARIFQSLDDGVSWSEITGDFPLDPVPAHISVDANGELYAWNGACYGSLCYCCSGASYRRIANSDLWELVLAENRSIVSFAPAPSASRTLYAVAEDYVLGPAPRVESIGLRSVDAGRHWVALAGLERLLAITPSPSSAVRLYALVGETGVAISANAGESWTVSSSGLADRSVRSLAVAPADDQVLYVGTATGVYRSGDGALSWEPTTLTIEARALAVDANDPEVVYAGTAAGVFATRDRGVTWTALNAGLTDLDVDSVAFDAGSGFLHVGTP